MSIRRLSGWHAIPFLIASALLASSAAQADELQDYAKLCDEAVGETVPDFDCDAGTEVPVTHPMFDQNGRLLTCDRPNRLHGVCDPGSRFQVLTRSDDVFTVAHCRKQGNGTGEYGDIAVIQYSRTNGATCFYQALGSGLPGGSSRPGALPGEKPVKAPSKGLSAWSWWSPATTASPSGGCGGCHDNGPFIRSPYLNQVTGPNTLPGRDDFGFNSNQPYAFVGKDFASWKALKVEVTDPTNPDPTLRRNECIVCHRMGVNNILRGRGTALDFGIRATTVPETSPFDGSIAAKNSPSADSPIWMPPLPVQVAFDSAHAHAAEVIRNCAIRWQEIPMPDSDACRITQFAGAFSIGIPLTGVVHLQDFGDRPLQNAEWAGTKGQARRLEGFSLNFSVPIQGANIEYTCHLQGLGDQPWMAEGTFCGTRGQSRRLEGFAIRLTGANAANFDVFYSCHVQDAGDTGPYKNGAFCGTRGQSKRVEALEVWVTPKSTLGLQGVVHLQDVGDLPFAQDMFAGTRGQSRRLEGFSLALSPPVQDLEIEYKCNLRDIGDTDWMRGGQFCGTRGQSRPLDGMAVRLTGPAAAMYDVYSLCHLQDFGDAGPVATSEFCGIRGQSLQLEALYVWIFSNKDDP